jgi:hypothetical protein
MGVFFWRLAFVGCFSVKAGVKAIMRVGAATRFGIIDSVREATA